MFALSQLGADGLRISLKCEPALAEQLRAAHAEVIGGYHLNKRLEHRPHCATNRQEQWACWGRRFR